MFASFDRGQMSRIWSRILAVRKWIFGPTLRLCLFLHGWLGILSCREQTPNTRLHQNLWSIRPYWLRGDAAICSLVLPIPPNQFLVPNAPAYVTCHNPGFAFQHPFKISYSQDSGGGIRASLDFFTDLRNTVHYWNIDHLWKILEFSGYQVQLWSSIIHKLSGFCYSPDIGRTENSLLEYLYRKYQTSLKNESIRTFLVNIHHFNISPQRRITSALIDSNWTSLLQPRITALSIECCKNWALVGRISICSTSCFLDYSIRETRVTPFSY